MTTAKIATRVARSEPIDDEYARLLEEISTRLQGGQSPDIEQYCRDYPHYAEDLRQLIPAMEMLGALAGPPSSANGSHGEHAAADLHGQPLGDFQIIREIGRGGMGIVYEAEQLSLGRRVALKVLPLAGMLDERQLQRFKNEAHAAASLHHAHIVPVYSVGSDRGVHYYSMQLVQGASLAELIAALSREVGGQRSEVSEEETEDRNQNCKLKIENSQLSICNHYSPPTTHHLPTDHSELRTPNSALETVASALSTEYSTSPKHYFRTAARIVGEIAEALEYAHSQGILHRDVKPANILLDASGKPWITDFGLAHLERGASLTTTGGLVGTLRYMSPEQVAGEALLDQRTDVYSLGATLYELLTLRPAFTEENRAQLLRQIAEDEPPSPRQVRPNVPHDLETIILKAIEKDPKDRYMSSAEVAADLRRYLNNEPIRATAPTFTHRCRKWVGRHQALAWATAITLLITTIILSGSTAIVVGAYRAERAQRFAKDEEYRRAEEQRRRAEQARQQERLARSDAELQRDAAADSLYLAHMRLAQRDWDGGQTMRLFSTLEQHLPAPGRPDLRGWEWYYLLSRCYGNYRTLRDCQTVWSVAWAPDGQSVAIGGEAGGVLLWDPNRGGKPITFHQVPAFKLSWSPTGRRLAAAGLDGVIRVWDVPTKTCLAEWPSFASMIYGLAWSSDGAMLAAARADRGIDIWDVASGQHRRNFHRPEDAYEAVAWHPDMRVLAVGGQHGAFDHVVQIIDATTGEVLTSKSSPRFDVLDLAWSPSGRHLAASFHADTAAVWSFDGAELGEVWSFLHTGSVNKMAWSATGQYLATASRGQQITVWDALTGTKHRTFQGHLGEVTSVDWSPDGKYLISGGEDGTVRIWDIRDNGGLIHVESGGLHNGWIQWSPDGNRILFPIQTGWRIITADGVTELDVEFRHLRVSKCCWSPDGEAVALFHAGEDSAVAFSVVNSRTGQELFTSGVPGSVWAISWSPDSKWLAVAYERTHVAMWDAKTWKKHASIEVPAAPAAGLAFSPDSTQLAVGDGDGGITLWNVNDLSQSGTLRGHRRWINLIAWSHDGRKIAAGGFLPEVRIWDVESRRELCTLSGHSSYISSLAWHRGGKQIASGSADGTLRIWSVDSGDELLVFQEGQGVVNAAWSPDGMKIASLCSGKLVVRDASAGFEAAAGSEFAQDRAMVRKRLADQAASSGQLLDADRLYRDVLELRSRAVGADHPSTLDIRFQLAKAIANQGRYSEAQVLFQEVLDVQRRVLGEKHHDLVFTIRALAGILEKQEELADAARMYREMVEISRHVYGDAHPQTLAAIDALVKILADDAERENLYSQMLEAERQMIREYPDDTIMSQHLAVQYAWFGMHEQHASLCEDLLSAAEESVVPEQLERAAKSWLIRPANGSPLTPRAIETARRGLELGTDNLQLLHWLQLAAGMAAYRAGQNAEAQELLVQASESSSASCRDLASVLLTMVRIRNGDRTQARRELEAIERRMGGSNARINSTKGILDNDRLAFWLAFEEAQALLENEMINTTIDARNSR
jgi:WD40 repeat protein/serine/threonine protein kinase/tetratricopeptide (TPR) repeat protein